jgi:hypothetical protein
MEKKECLRTEISKTTEQKARFTLQTFLDENRLAIRAMRSYHQIPDSGIVVSLDQMKTLEKAIKEESHEALYWFGGCFCTIGDNDTISGQDNNQFLGLSEGEKVKVVKGFSFNFNIGRRHFECVDLDFGLSRQYFDKKSPQEKKDFVRKFAERENGSSSIPLEDLKNLPLGFAAFINDDGKKFRIEEFVPYRDCDREWERLGL